MILRSANGRRSLAASLSLAVAALALASCGATPTSAGVVDVVAAEVQYGDVLSQIGGRYVHVTSLISNPAADPHNFEASPRVAQAISSATLVVQNGDGYDAFMNKLESASASPSRVVLSVAALLERRSAANPHLWYVPTAMPLLAASVTRSLATILPRRAEYFRQRDAGFVTSWRRVTSALAAARRAVGGDVVATTEPVGDYLLAAMGLRNDTPFRFQADVMNGIDPSPEDIVAERTLLARHRVTALVYNAQVTSPVTRLVVDQAIQDHVATVPVYEIMPAGLHVQTWMLATISALGAALKGGGR